MALKIPPLMFWLLLNNEKLYYYADMRVSKSVLFWMGRFSIAANLGLTLRQEALMYGNLIIMIFWDVVYDSHDN